MINIRFQYKLILRSAKTLDLERVSYKSNNSIKEKSEIHLVAWAKFDNRTYTRQIVVKE